MEGKYNRGGSRWDIAGWRGSDRNAGCTAAVATPELTPQAYGDQLESFVAAGLMAFIMVPDHKDILNLNWSYHWACDGHTHRIARLC